MVFGKLTRLSRGRFVMVRANIGAQNSPGTFVRERSPVLFLRLHHFLRIEAEGRGSLQEHWVAAAC